MSTITTTEARVLICGSRDWAEGNIISTVILGLKARFALFEGANLELVIVEGETRGADSLARDVAKANRIKVMPFPADWDKHGKAAGPIRNQQMLDEAKPGLVIGFTNDLASSKGTKDMLTRARKAGLRTYVISEVL